ncbi:MAG TPA: SpoIIE family protein phosphatase [bacterium]|nr:SpoIIE family protein phosphatase [bacterium]HQG45926.1 SpoIIE family protein phosphatase [bacterium]HQJ66050.1 SpoIIE family protein phosphatase [bacterium]
MADLKKEQPGLRTILVVEDDPHLRRLFVEILRRDAYHVLEADSGEAALTILENSACDVVISDMQMQQLSGLDVLHAALAKDPITQVLIITGYASVGTAVRAMREGAYEYLTKPVQPEALSLKVRNACERRRLLQTLAKQESALEAHHSMIERDLTLARQVQASLVPEGYSSPLIDVGITYIPMIGLGGDFADIHVANEEKIYLAVIDVTGHGIAAALLVSRVCHEWRSQLQSAPDPAEVLWHLNEFFLRTFADTPLFLTIMAVECDLRKKTLRYAGSAHPAALLWHADNESISRLDSQNAIIGFAHADRSAFRSVCLPYAPGDLLLVYTDGVIEAETREGKILGLQGLQRIIRQQKRELKALQTSAAIIRQVVEFTKTDLGDDVLMLVARLT